MPAHHPPTEPSRRGELRHFPERTSVRGAAQHDSRPDLVDRGTAPERLFDVGLRHGDRDADLLRRIESAFTKVVRIHGRWVKARHVASAMLHRIDAQPHTYREWRPGVVTGMR